MSSRSIHIVPRIVNALKKFFLAILIAGVSLEVVGQDIHFSQFMHSPLNLNPAQTGNFKGGYRIAGNFRRQWSSVTIPYQTFGLSADAKDFMRLKNVGTGISLYYDETGDSHFSTLQMNLSASYRIPFDPRGDEYLIFGIQSGFTQRRIDYSNLTFDNQYNGFVYDAAIPSQESFANAGRIYPNLNTGINYTKNFEKRKNISGGIALFNLTKPKQSFFGNDEIVLDRRLSFNAAGQYPLTGKFDLLPAMLFMAQGTYREFIIGSSLKYIMEDTRLKYRALYVGGWARTRDAGFINIGMDYDEWYVGLSYDVNLSNLRPASQGRGGFELAVIYLIPENLPKRQRYKVCPEFL